MNEQEKKRQRIYDLLIAEKAKVSLSNVHKAKKFFFREKEFF